MDFRALEKVLTCPYNPSHQILPHRMAQHLVKCKKSHPDADMRVCVFNATHVVPSHLYQAHILQCPDRAIVERDIYRKKEVEAKLQEKKEMMENQPPVPTHEVCVDEDWDAETVTSSYNPTMHVLHREVARPPPPGLGKSARKQWREVELERIRRLKAGEPINDLVYPMKGSVESMVNRSQNNLHILAKKESTLSMATSMGSLVMQSSEPLRRPRIAAAFVNPPKEENEQYEEEINPETRELMKQEKRVKKMLKQINKLEEKQINGGRLTHAEEVKVRKKTQFTIELSELQKKMEDIRF